MINLFTNNFNLIAETAELLNTTMIDLVKTSEELSNVKSDLTKSRIDLAAAEMKLGEINNELTNTLEANFNLTQEFLQNLASTMTELISTKSTVADMTIKLNGKKNKKFQNIREE